MQVPVYRIRHSYTEQHMEEDNFKYAMQFLHVLHMDCSAIYVPVPTLQIIVKWYI